MTTLLQNLGTINRKEAVILIEKYLDIVEDLEDYVAIEKHKNGNMNYLNENESKQLFDSLIK